MYIFGIHWLAFIAVSFVLVLIIVYIYWLNWNKKRREYYSSLVEDQHLCEFISEDGSVTELCPVFKGQAKRIQKGSRAGFLVNTFIKHKSDADKNAEPYYILPEHSYPVRYPENKPRNQQVIVMKSHYLVGDPIPQITYRPDLWNPDVYERVTTAMNKYAFEEKTLQMVTSEIAQIWENIEEFLRVVKLIKPIGIGVLILMLMIAGALVVVISHTNKLDYIINQLANIIGGV